ncbi:Stf0 family sulfotransferase [Actibacterium lipolyticum]|uniref:Stf0 sulfotransferase n=1 Tax=Actibacterium lipolyticum TaxID=1524263 RepID=A0A238JKG2_9RHOB|nr:Stf0 family sulfotransferase [Actibacterium lipolyticum]SMX31158.1 Stf0 sulfotransferase [Actibacterium lipolyticum]
MSNRSDRDRPTNLWDRQFSSDFDFPPTDATTHVVICSTPRSGSHFLSHQLHETGAFGYPLEYLNPANFREWARLSGSDDDRAVFDFIKGKRTGRNGVFALKMHYSHLPLFLKLEPDPQRYSFLHVSRQSKIDQAVSFARASQTKSWISDMPEVAEAHYDWELIFDKLTSILVDEAKWQAYFLASGISPLMLEYETILQNSQATINAASSFCGIDISNAPPSAVKFKPQKQARSGGADWSKSFLAEGTEKIAGIVTSRAKQQVSKNKNRSGFWAALSGFSK